MSCVNVNIGGESCLNLKKGADVSDFIFFIFYADGNPYNLVDITDLKISVYETTRTRVVYSASDLEYGGNGISWTAQWAQINLPIGVYYHELSYQDDGGNKVIIEFGTFNII